MIQILRTAMAEGLGLFVDDGWLAAGSVLLIAAVTSLTLGLHLDPLAAGVLLLLGCVVILLLSIFRHTRSHHDQA